MNKKVMKIITRAALCVAVQKKTQQNNKKEKQSKNPERIQMKPIKDNNGRRDSLIKLRIT